jgi:hypothetical protein
MCRPSNRRKTDYAVGIAKAQTMIFKTLHRQLYMENHELQEKLEVDSGAHEKQTHDPSCDSNLAPFDHRRSWHGPPPFITFCLQIYFQ